jgi:NTE family protein
MSEEKKTIGGSPTRDGVALCLSGGGYRAMLFHVGALWRLNELGTLERLKFISSVSGGSIAAGALAQAWPSFTFTEGVATNYIEQVAVPLRRLAAITIDRPAVLSGLLRPGRTIGGEVQTRLREQLFGDTTLASLAPEPAPRFIFTATNLQSGSLWRFSSQYMRDWQVGRVSNPTVPLSQVVAASAAFPPLLSPIHLDIDADRWDLLEERPDGAKEWPPQRVTLSDGGVYDNLGLEPVIKRAATILVSDGGGHIAYSDHVAADWVRHLGRVLGVVDNQVRSLRKRQLIDDFGRAFTGTYWGIRSDIADFAVPHTLSAPFEETRALAKLPTRLAKLSPATMDALVNWGYAVCDASMRRWVDVSPDRPPAFPYPSGTAS